MTDEIRLGGAKGGPRPPEAPRAEPRIIGGRYLLHEGIGRGRCAEVALATDMKEGRPVAAKLGLPGGDAEWIRAVFRNEARALEMGAHPNVVKLLDADTAAREPFIIMEHLPGPTLSALFYQGGGSRRASLTLIAQICSALEAMHGKGLVHRDLKPKNVMLDSAQDALLIDLGFAYVPGMPDLTAGSGSRFGNPAYSPPEGTNGANDPRADIFSAGMMMYEMLRGKGHLPILDLARLLSLRRVPSILSAQVAMGLVEPDAAEVIGRAISRDPEERFQSALEMRKGVERILQSIPPDHCVII